MSAILSGSLAQALNAQVIQEQFDIVRPDINGLLALASFGEATRPEDGHKINWLDMSVGADTLQVDGAVTAVATSITVDDGSKARTGMVLENDGEFIVVTSVTGNVLTVLRAQGGTTGAAITDNFKLSVESIGREENSLAETDGIYQPEEVENFFQTMDTAVEMSRRALAVLQHGNTNDLSFQVNERIRQLATQMNKALMRGRKMDLTIGGKKTTYTGGLGFFFDQAGALSTDHAAAALTLDAINELQAEIKTRGGSNTSALVVGIKQARALQALVNAQYGSQRLGDFVSDQGGLVRLPSDLPQIGGASMIVIDTNMKDDELFLIDASRLTIVPMAQGNAMNSGAWRTIDATTPGQDGQKARIIGDFAMEIRDSKTHHARLTNIA
tara:strand:+ start:2126 stop:3280 length:1155 start_codon:yes stop_codon:yes gene_type:complete